MQERLVTDVHLAERYSVTRQTIWRWARETDFPQPIRLSGRCTRWRLSAVEAWEAEQLKEGA